jgi:hypothetical protein
VWKACFSETRCPMATRFLEEKEKLAKVRHRIEMGGRKQLFFFYGKPKSSKIVTAKLLAHAQRTARLIRQAPEHVEGWDGTMGGSWPRLGSWDGYSSGHHQSLRELQCGSQSVVVSYSTFCVVGIRVGTHSPADPGAAARIIIYELYRLRSSRRPPLSARDM